MSREPSIQEEKKLSGKKPELSELCRILQYIFLPLDFFALILSITLVVYLIFANMVNFPYPETVNLAGQMKLFCFSALLFTISSFCGGAREILLESPCYPDETVLFQRNIISSLICGLPLFFLLTLRLTINFQTYGSFILIILFYILICLGIQSSIILLSDKYLHRAILFLRNQAIIPEDPYFGSEEIKNINEDLFSSYEMYLQLHQNDRVVSRPTNFDGFYLSEETAETTASCLSNDNSKTTSAYSSDNNVPNKKLNITIEENLSTAEQIASVSDDTDTTKDPCFFDKNPKISAIRNNPSLQKQNTEENNAPLENKEENNNNNEVDIKEKKTNNNDRSSNNNEDDEEESGEDYLNENLYQQQNWIFEQEEGIRIEGWIKVFEKNDFSKQRTIHLSFCPPFPHMPKFHLEQISGAPVQLTATRIFPFGARFEVKRLHIDETESTRFCYFASLK